MPAETELQRGEGGDLADEKIFDVIKVKKALPVKPLPQSELKPTKLGLHIKFFDWHSVAYILFGFAIILIFIAAATITRFVIIKNQKQTNTQPTAQTQGSSNLVESTPTSEAVETKSEIDNPFAPPVEDKPVAVDKSTIKIRILNGNGVAGDAAKAKKQLEDDGFKVESIANAKRQDYTITEIYHIADKKAQGEAVESALKTAGRTTNLQEASQDLVGSNFEILVITGEK